MGPDQEAGAGGTATAPALTGLEFRRLGPENGDDLLAYLAGGAFSDNPRWADCFCFFYHFSGDGQAWAARTGEENRRDKAARIAERRAHGVLAYLGGEVVGWVHAAPRSDLDAFDRWEVPRDERLGQVVCFVVHPEHRRRGIGRRLLNEACAMLRELGMAYVDALPPRTVERRDGLPETAVMYHGTREMYADAGFELVEDDAARPFVRMRKLLA